MKKGETKNNLLGGESNPGQPGDSRLYLTTILPKISHFYWSLFIFFNSINNQQKQTKTILGLTCGKDQNPKISFVFFFFFFNFPKEAFSKKVVFLRHFLLEVMWKKKKRIKFFHNWEKIFFIMLEFLAKNFFVA